MDVKVKCWESCIHSYIYSSVYGGQNCIVSVKSRGDSKINFFEKKDLTQRSGYKQASLILKFVRHGLLNDEAE